MDYKAFVRKHYQNAIEKNTWANRELIASLRHHERVPSFIDNLAVQLKKAQEFRIKSGKPPFKIETIAWSVNEMTEVFLRGIESKANQRAESEIAKYQRKHAMDEANDIEQTLAGNPSGDYADLDIEIGETQEISLEDHNGKAD